MGRCLYFVTLHVELLGISYLDLLVVCSYTTHPVEQVMPEIHKLTPLQLKIRSLFN